MRAKDSSHHKIYIDFLRIFAIFLVLFNHTYTFHRPFSHTCTTLLDFTSLVVSICDKIAVPLFFMISGALLLPKDESIQTLIKHRVLRFLIVIFLYQILQHCYGFYACGAETSIKDCAWNCLVGAYCGAHNYAVWFLYAYLAVILMLPLLRLLVKQMTTAHYLYLFTIQLIFIAFIPSTSSPLSRSLILCNNVFLYVLAGYYIEHRISIDKVTRKHKLLLMIFSIICILLGAALCEAARCLNNAQYIQQTTLCFNGCILIPCITLYLMVKQIFIQIKHTGVIHLFSLLGGSVFTIMLMENILRDTAGKMLYGHMHYMFLHDTLTVILACCMGFPIGIILKKIPIINRLV